MCSGWRVTGQTRISSSFGSTFGLSAGAGSVILFVPPAFVRPSGCVQFSRSGAGVAALVPALAPALSIVSMEMISSARSVNVRLCSSACFSIGENGQTIATIEISSPVGVFSIVSQSAPSCRAAR